MNSHFRSIIGLAIDSLSPDNGRNGFPVHHTLLGRNIWIIENLANVDALPEFGYDFFNMMYKIEDGSGAPSRAFAIRSGMGPSAAVT